MGLDKKGKMEEKNIGMMVIISGASGAGKDSVMDGFLKDTRVQRLNLKKIVTCTDRPLRPGETDGVQYHFINNEELQKMAVDGLLVEPITMSGTAGKATPKSEIDRLFAGENLVWRIDPSRASDVASGDFYRRIYPERAQILQEHTIVLSIVAPREEVEKRRMGRDLERYNPTEYAKRDTQEKPYLEILAKKAVLIRNLDGKLDQAINTAVISVVNLYDKIKT